MAIFSHQWRLKRPNFLGWYKRWVRNHSIVRIIRHPPDRRRHPKYRFVAALRIATHSHSQLPFTKLPLTAAYNQGARMAEERLSPKHPDWCWIQLPMEQLLVERSVPFDAKVEYAFIPSSSKLRCQGRVRFHTKLQQPSVYSRL